MSRFYDVLETRLPAEREQELLTALQVQLSHVKTHTSWGTLLEQVVPQDINTAQDMAQLPVLRKSDLKGLQDQHKPFGGLVAAKMSNIKYIFSSPGPLYMSQRPSVQIIFGLLVRSMPQGLEQAILFTIALATI